MYHYIHTPTNYNSIFSIVALDKFNAPNSEGSSTASPRLAGKPPVGYLQDSYHGSSNSRAASVKKNEANLGMVQKNRHCCSKFSSMMAGACIKDSKLRKKCHHKNIQEGFR